MTTEEINNIPVGLLCRWINEEVRDKKHELVTDEDILMFIKLGYERRAALKELTNLSEEME